MAEKSKKGKSKYDKKVKLAQPIGFEELVARAATTRPQKKSINERITEDIIRTHFKTDPLYSTIKIEEQKSIKGRIAALLEGSSKKGSGIGKPEFIITFPTSNLDYLIVIECKAETKHHRSKSGKETEKFAVDGVLHYAKALSKGFDVVAIAASGQTEEELLVSHFVWKKESSKHSELKNDKNLLCINDYLKLFNNESFSENLKYVDIVKKAIDLNELYHGYSITEMTRCTIVSAILVALVHKPFRKGYKDYENVETIGKAILSAIEAVLKKHSVKNPDSMMGEYNKILNEPLFLHEQIKHKNHKERQKSVDVIKEMILYLEMNVYPLVEMEDSGFDVLGKFYTEFIRYAGSEQSVGLVLTPSHITDLFCDLAELNTNSIIYDPVCGTAGFLISGMKRMIILAGSNDEKKTEIKNKQLVGVELRPSMFTYACSNMMLRGDGKSNIYCGDCFTLVETVQKHKPNVAFLNPPYDVGPARQLEFIEHALNVVSPQGTVVAIVQMSCCISTEGSVIAVRNRLLSKHRLKAVLSMPDELFNPAASVVTSILVFKANEKNEGRQTWFGYFKDDGLEKRKHKGRIDAKSKWKEIRDRWISAYHDLGAIPGLSAKREVTGEDEWCAEAYMETDYSTLSSEDFLKNLKEYVLFNELYLK